ncbi:MltR family transcriptional regulator [Vibrio gallicus]|uniref:MltR family transcriptional regulator n=1 Tax=Vibrio gallicus TaxID=190897 RepID=UPI0021C3ACD2|nr:MltR family transcriptional regulator [Vibrio gallicus]
MPISSEYETELLEALADSQNACECLMTAYDALEDTLDALLKAIFYKEDYAVKYVVDPLLTNEGPLGEILVRTKLLLGLGSISKEIYDDIEIFVTLREWAKIEGDKVSFSDPNVIFELNRIHTISAIMPIEFNNDIVTTLSGTTLDMFLVRHFQKVRSTIVLAITEIIHSLSKDNELNS